MRCCEKCGVRVLGELPCCPLCQGPLTGTAEADGAVYPLLPLDRRPHRLLLRLLALASGILVVVCGALLLCLPEYTAAALSVIVGLGNGWLIAGVAVKKRGKPLKAVFWQVCLLSVLLLAWDRGTGGRGWSLDFALPILYLFTMVTMAVIARLLRLRPSDYLLYLVLNILLGLVPLLLLFCGKLRVIYPAVICAAVSLIFLVALLLFQGRALVSELHRRLHL